jgi:WD40 repeat protein
LWAAADGQLRRTIAGHTNAVLSLAFSPNGQRLASGTHYNTAILWHPTTGEKVHTLQGENTHTPGGHLISVVSVAFDPSGTRLFSGSNDGTVRVWNVATGQLIRTVHLPESFKPVFHFEADGTVTIATPDGGSEFQVWRLP